MRIIFCLLAFVGYLKAQEFDWLGPEPALINLGESAKLTLILKGEAKVVWGLMPELIGIKFLPRTPSFAVRGSDMTTSAEIDIQAKMAGEFEIPSFRFQWNQKIFHTPKGRSLRVVESAKLGDLARLETSIPSPSVFAGQEFVLQLRFLIEESFSRANLLQAFKQDLDLPVAFVVPWAEGWDAVQALPESKVLARDHAATVVLNSAKAIAEVRGTIQRGAKTYQVFAIKRRFLAAKAGLLRIPGSWARVVYAEEFADDFFAGRVPKEKKVAYVYGNSLEIEVEDLAFSTTSSGFEGGVGRFEFRAMMPAAQIRLGESFRVVFELRGEGNLEDVIVPTLDKLPGLRSQGMLRSRGLNWRRFSYDFEVVDPELKHFPSVEWQYFDVEPPARLKTLVSARLPLTVSGFIDAKDSMVRIPIAAVNRSKLRLAGLKPLAGPVQDVPCAPSQLFVLVMAVLPFVVAMFFRRWLVAREFARQHPQRHRAHLAARKFLRRMKAGATNNQGALVEYLGARTMWEEGALFDPDLREKLSSLGISSSLSQETQTTLRRIVASRYGGPSRNMSSDELSDLVARLELEFRRLEESV